MEVKTKKEELLNWIKSLKDPNLISELYALKKRDEFDFDKEFGEGQTPEEFRQDMFKKIEAFPWKK
jgi:hypothetical protein